MSFNAFRENKILAKISESTVCTISTWTGLFVLKVYSSIYGTVIFFLFKVRLYPLKNSLKMSFTRDSVYSFTKKLLPFSAPAIIADKPAKEK